MLALLTVLGIIAIGVWLGHEQPPPTARTHLATPSQPSTAVAATRTMVAQAPASTSGAPAIQMAVAVPQTIDMTAVASLPTPPLSTAATASVESLTDPLSTELALVPGEAARVRVTVGGVSTPLLLPNQVGSFPRVYLPLGGQADVQLQLPEAEPGERVVAAVEDGGQFADGKPVQTLTLDGNRQVAFRFQASQSLGTFRISVRHATQTKIVTFWAGDRTASFNY